MFSFDFSIELPITTEKLFEILKNFTLIKELLPDQVQECDIIQQNKDETITKELLRFKSFFGNQVLSQQTSHQASYSNFFCSSCRRFYDKCRHSFWRYIDC